MKSDESRERKLKREADRISSLIIASDYPAIDIVIEIRNLRAYVSENMPDKLQLFEMVYESRFKRLWEQFREEEKGPLPEW